MRSYTCVLVLLLTACGTVGYDGALASDGAAASDAQGVPPADSQGACGGEGTILCEDFEGDLSRWTEFVSNGALSLSAADGRSGQGLRIDHPGSGSTMLKYALPEFDNLYARAWFRLSPGDGFAPWVVFMELRQDPYRGEKISLDGVNVDSMQIVLLHSEQNVNARGGALPRGDWFCAELFVNIGNPGVAWAQAAGVKVELPLGINTVPTEGRFNTFLLGVSTPGLAMQASVDDVLLSETYVPCPN